jgi:RHS repeat-associated protein
VAESFTALGARRGANWQGTPTPAELAAIASTTRDGFTGHVMLDNVGLVHMQGRVYDPAIGRFLSVDPVVCDVAAPQSWNGYGYVEGRALSWTDPSGYSACPGRQPGSACTIVPINPTVSNIPPPPPIPGNVPVLATVTARKDLPPEGISAVAYTNFWGGFDMAHVTWGDEPGALSWLTPQPVTHSTVCQPVDARILGGNPATVGRPGGFSGSSSGDIRLRRGSAAVDPSQWGGKTNLRPNLDHVSGRTVGGQSFRGITDVIGSTDVENVREMLATRYPGALLIELVTGYDESVTTIVITVPAGMLCPEVAYEDRR